MRPVFFAALFAVSALRAAPTSSLDPVVVSATREEIPLKESARSITVITEEDIARKNPTTLFDLFRGVDGVYVSRNGGPGGVASVFIRGGRSDYTLVLIDGVKVGDPTSPGGAFSFGNLDTAQVQRIEILRGPQSSLYGSEAMAGVINIITKKSGRGQAAEVSVEAGDFNTYRQSGFVKWGSDLADVSLSASHRSSDGFNITYVKQNPKAPVPEENDASRILNVAGTLRLRLAEGHEDTLSFSASDAWSQIDNFGDALEIEEENERYSGRLQHAFNTDRFGLTGGFGFARNNRRQRDKPDDWDFFQTDSEFNTVGERYLGDLKVVARGEGAEASLGVETEVRRYAADIWGGYFTTSYPEIRYDHSLAVFLQGRKSFDKRLFVGGGVRGTGHSQAGNDISYNLDAAWLLEDYGLKFRSALGSGFKAPTLYQSQDPQFGNPRLKPSKS